MQHLIYVHKLSYNKTLEFLQFNFYFPQKMQQTSQYGKQKKTEEWYSPGITRGHDPLYEMNAMRKQIDAMLH